MGNDRFQGFVAIASGYHLKTRATEQKRNTLSDLGVIFDMQYELWI